MKIQNIISFIGKHIHTLAGTYQLTKNSRTGKYNILNYILNNYPKILLF